MKFAREKRFPHRVSRGKLPEAHARLETLARERADTVTALARVYCYRLSRANAANGIYRVCPREFFFSSRGGFLWSSYGELGVGRWPK